MVVGYLRVSTEKQHLSNQQDEILRFAQTRNMEIDRWVTEVVSGKKDQKDRKLGSILRRLKNGDSLIVTEISRLSRTLTEIMTIMGHCLDKGITLYSTKDGYAFDDTINSKVLCFAFGLVAEIEREPDLDAYEGGARPTQGRRRAARPGRKGFCPKFRILSENCAEIVEMLRNGATIVSVCRKYQVSVDTFKAFRKRHAQINDIIEHRNKIRGIRQEWYEARRKSKQE